MRGFSGAQHADFNSMKCFLSSTKFQPRGCNFRQINCRLLMAMTLMSAILSQIVGSVLIGIFFLER